MAIVSGRLSTRRYEDKNGNKRTSYEVVASNIYFAGSKAKSETDSAPQSFEDLADDDIDLPF